MLRHKIASPTNLVAANQTSSQQQTLVALNESQAMQLVSLVENLSDETFLDCFASKKAKQQTNSLRWTMT